jgi:hypothetical protein
MNLELRIPKTPNVNKKYHSQSNQLSSSKNLFDCCAGVAAVVEDATRAPPILLGRATAAACTCVGIVPTCAADVTAGAGAAAIAVDTTA